MSRCWPLLGGMAGLLILSTTSAQPPGGPGGPGGFMGQERKVVKQFDKDNDGRLNTEERKAARESIKGEGRGRFGPGGGGPGGRDRQPAKPGPKVSPDEVQSYPKAGLYEPTVLRTLFLEFENKDWEAELADFHNTDVEVPATLTVDGKKYPNVGVHFRGMSSYGMVPAGYKRSLNLSMDFANAKQKLYGYKTLNLLNAAGDSSLLSSVLYSHIARQHTPAPKANLVKVVINGESWGIYTNVQQFNKDFVDENFKKSKGARWKVSGSPAGGGGLEYLGDNIDNYKRRYEIKSGDDEKAWKALVNLCKVLNQTPPEKLEEALKPIVDIDNLLWFLALDVTLINSDGYWIRASDYSMYLDEKGKFHFFPHDMNEAFRPGGGPGGPGGPGGFNFVLPRPGEVLPPPVQDTLKLTDEQKKQLEKLQKEVDGDLEKILTGDQNKQLKEMRDRGPGAFGPGPGGPGGGPGGRPGGPGGDRGPGGPGGRGPGGPGFGGGSGGLELDPLTGLTDARKPLRSKLLAVPSLRAKYLGNVRTLAEKSLDWKTLGPVVAQYRKLIEKEVEADTRKLSTLEAFQRATADDATGGARGRETSLRTFADQRRKYLMEYKEPAKEEPKRDRP